MPCTLGRKPAGGAAGRRAGRRARTPRLRVRSRARRDTRTGSADADGPRGAARAGHRVRNEDERERTGPPAGRGERGVVLDAKVASEPVDGPHRRSSRPAPRPPRAPAADLTSQATSGNPSNSSRCSRGGKRRRRPDRAVLHPRRRGRPPAPSSETASSPPARRAPGARATRAPAHAFSRTSAMSP